MWKQTVYVLVCAIFCDVIVSPRHTEETCEDTDTSEYDSGTAINVLRNGSHHESSSGSSSSTKISTTTRAPWVTPKIVILPNGPYFEFLTNICNALISTKFSRLYVGRYFGILSKSLKGLGIDYLQKIWITRLRKSLYKYSEYNKRTLKIKVHNFLAFISDGRPKKNEYFKAMNAIYTVNDERKMDDYVYALKNYGKRVSRHIADKTRKVFLDIIFARYRRQRDGVKEDIELKFKSAVIEYWEERLNLTAFNFTSLFNHISSKP